MIKHIKHTNLYKMQMSKSETHLLLPSLHPLNYANRVVVRDRGVLVLAQRALVHGELDGVRSGAGSKVVHPRLEPLSPAVEVEGGELGKGGLHHVHVERLALINEGATLGRHVHQAPLPNLPHRLVDRLQLWGEGVQVLHAALRGHQFVLHARIPQPQRHQIRQQVLVHHRKLPAQHATDVNVARVRLEALIVPQNLAGAGRGHGRHQQAVPDAVGGDVSA
mmetsp:Transcript_5149/g.9357  ORF Transcript_5149/g.9357 Transcript_5149/m.9357 type:complete len:221 (+) Transcript_5149:217-879(+)